jgi:inosine-uridine nucleoside N-ribohydrolase
MNLAKRLERLQPPTGKVSMVLDTDAACEVDDQFSIVYSLLSPEKIDLEAIYLAPYQVRPDSPTLLDTIENSYLEATKVLKMLGRSSDNFVYKGAIEYLCVESPQATEVTNDLIERAMGMSPNDPPLYVGAIGTITNIAAAILIEPEIIERIVVVWLGGSSHHRPSALEYNLVQDIPAVQTVLNSGVPFIQMPCRDVTSHLVSSVPELTYFLKGRGEIGDYLLDIVTKYGETQMPGLCGWSKVLWDIVVPAWLINHEWVDTDLIHSPILTTDGTWSIDTSRHFVRVARQVNRDQIFKDLFTKIDLLK